LALHHSDREGVIRFRQIENHRMPLLAYLSFSDPQALTRGDFARLALIAGACARNAKGGVRHRWLRFAADGQGVG